MSMFQLFYVSRATRTYNSAAIQHILQMARYKNRKLDITGCLLYSGRCFAQVLEGTEAAVRPLAERIASDPRHADVRVLMESHRVEREYGDWSTGYLHDRTLEDRLEKFFLAAGQNPSDVADVLSRMKPDTVMGALQ